MEEPGNTQSKHGHRRQTIQFNHEWKRIDTNENGCAPAPWNQSLAGDPESACDAVLTNTNAHSIAVLLGNGTGGFGAPIVIATAAFPTNGFVDDFNGDGRADVGFMVRNDREYSVLTNTTVPLPPPPPPGSALFHRRDDHLKSELACAASSDAAAMAGTATRVPVSLIWPLGTGFSSSGASAARSHPLPITTIASRMAGSVGTSSPA